MTVRELLEYLSDQSDESQLYINAFLDEFRAAPPAARPAMIAAGPQRSGASEGLVAAVVSALCREVDLEPPAWVARTVSPAPFFVFPARSFALRLRLMLESPPPFRSRNVFVPENYLARA